ncbi:MAG: lysophospholipid acyltransferase family protein [Planctomycetota bacterium]
MYCDSQEVAGPAVRYDLPHLIQLTIAPLLIRPLMRFLYRVRVRAAPGAFCGPCVFASNHRSFLDPIAVSAFGRRPISFFARRDLWRLPIAREFLLAFRALPVDRDEPQLAIMRRTVEHLRSGFAVLIFPEGTRTRTGRLGRLRSGPAVFARRAGVPVVPVYLHATDAIWPRGRILPGLDRMRLEVVYGPPLRAPADLPRRLQERWLSRAIERWLQRTEQRFMPATAGPRPECSDRPDVRAPVRA